MNLQFYLEKLISSEEFQKFKKENPTAFLCSGFFSIDKTGKEGDKQHLDYFIPELNKMFSFKFEKEKVEMIPVEDFGNNFTPIKIRDNCDFDFQKIENLIKEKMSEEKMKKNIEKILLSLQIKDGKEFLVGAVFISGLGMIKLTINIQEKKIIDFEKKSFFDMLKIIKKKPKSSEQQN